MLDYATLVNLEDGTIDRRLFAHAQVFEDELERLFTRAWLFVGHESLIPKPNDYFLSRMGTESVILCRDRAGTIHVLLNSCRHRGMKVCRYDSGNTPQFTCPYHAWSYGTDGKLVGVPMFDEIYKGVLNKDAWPLAEVAQLANYKGTIWATWDPEAPTFEDYLGGMREHLDRLLDARDGREGGSEVLLGVQKSIVPANWKLGAENFSGDRYHNVSHRSVDDVGIGPSARSGLKGRRDQFSPGHQRVLVTFPHGHGSHCVLQPEENAYIPTYGDDEVVEDYYRRCFEERKKRLGEKARIVGFNGTVFPNAGFLAQQPRLICVMHPHTPTTTEVWRFFLCDRDAPEEVKDFLRHYNMRYSGPAGMTEQDDFENWQSATNASRGTIAQRYPFNYQQSLHASTLNDPLPGMATTAVSEQNPRGLYKRWLEYLNGSANGALHV